MDDTPTKALENETSKDGLKK